MKLNFFFTFSAFFFNRFPPLDLFYPGLKTVCFKYITINLNHKRIRGNPVCAEEIRIVEIKNGKYDNEMCELPYTVIITVKKGNIVYIMHDVSHEILILDTIYDF